jgi:hypothetical protein
MSFHISQVISSQLMPVDNKPYPYVMPSESSFKNQIELTRSALAKFEAIAVVGFRAATQPALDEVIAVTGDFNKYNPYFINDPRFFEAPTQVYKVLEDFFTKNPTYTKTTAYNKVIGLNQRSKIMASTAAKKGTHFFYSTFPYFFERLTIIS